MMATPDGEGLRYAWEGSVKNQELQNYQEFEKRVSGVEGGSVAVVGCKCRDGPIVRVLNQCYGKRQEQWRKLVLLMLFQD